MKVLFLLTLMAIAFSPLHSWAQKKPATGRMIVSANVISDFQSGNTSKIFLGKNKWITCQYRGDLNRGVYVDIQATTHLEYVNVYTVNGATFTEEELKSSLEAVVNRRLQKNSKYNDLNEYLGQIEEYLEHVDPDDERMIAKVDREVEKANLQISQIEDGIKKAAFKKEYGDLVPKKEVESISFVAQSLSASTRLSCDSVRTEKRSAASRQTIVNLLAERHITFSREN